MPEGRHDPLDPLLPEQDVRARDAEIRPESIQRLVERFGVVGCDRHRRDEADVVVRVDPDPFQQPSVGPEGLVRDAVAELLERAAAVPGLDDRRLGARLDDVEREEVVIDDDDPAHRDAVAGAGTGPQGPEAVAQATPADRARVLDDLDVGRPPAQLVAQHRQVAAETARMGRREDDSATHRPASSERESKADAPGAEGDEEAGRHRGRAGAVGPDRMRQWTLRSARR